MIDRDRPPPLGIVGDAVDQRAQGDDKLGTPFDRLSHCRWCFGWHPGACPYIRITEWHPNGQIARVVLKERPQQEQVIIYPEETDELNAALLAIAGAKSVREARAIARRVLEPEE